MEKTELPQSHTFLNCHRRHRRPAPAMTHVLPFFSEISCCHGRRDPREGLAKRSLLSTSSLPLPPSLGRKAPVSAAAYGYPWHVERHRSKPKMPPLAGDADDAEM